MGNLSKDPSKSTIATLSLSEALLDPEAPGKLIMTEPFLVSAIALSQDFIEEDVEIISVFFKIPVP